MLEQYVRQSYQYYCVDGLVDYLKEYLTPIQVTLMSGVFGVFVPLALVTGNSVLAIFFLLLSGYLDTVDGTLARKTGMTSDAGSLLDILMDRIVECAVIIGLWLSFPDDRALPCLLMLASVLLCVTSFLTVGIFTENRSEKSFHYSSGIIERAEAFIFFVLMIWFDRYFLTLSSCFISLVLLTTFVRVYEFLNQR